MHRVNCTSESAGEIVVYLCHVLPEFSTIIFACNRCSDSSEKIRKKEENKEGSEGKDKHLKKDETKEEDAMDKKDRKYYKVIISFSYANRCTLFYE